MYVCLKCNTKKIASHCCQLSAAGCSVGHRMFVFGPTRTGVSKKFWANVQTKEKSYGEFLWPYLKNFAGNIPGPTLSGWKKLRCPFITFKSTQCMLYVSDVL